MLQKEGEEGEGYERVKDMKWLLSQPKVDFILPVFLSKSFVKGT